MEIAKACVRVCVCAWSSVLATVRFRAVSPRICRAGRGLVLPWICALALDPVTRYGVALEVAVAVPVALLEQLEQGVAQRGVHADALPREVAAHAVAREALFEERFLVRAPAVEVARGRHPRRVRPPFSPRIVPRAKRVPGAVKGAEHLDARVGARTPFLVERGWRLRRGERRREAAWVYSTRDLGLEFADALS